MNRTPPLENTIYYLLPLGAIYDFDKINQIYSKINSKSYEKKTMYYYFE